MENQKLTDFMPTPREKKYFTTSFTKQFESKPNTKHGDTCQLIDLTDNESEKTIDQKETIDNEIKSSESRILERCLKDMLINKWGSLKEIYDDEFQSLVKKFSKETIETKFTNFENVKSNVSKIMFKDIWSKNIILISNVQRF